MAVEAGHLSVFPPQLVANREMLRPVEGSSPYSLQIGYGLPLSGTTTVDTAALLPMYMDSLPPRTPLKSDTGLTHHIPLLSRKRSRDSSGQVLPYTVPTNFSFLGEDISVQIEQQQLDVSRLIARHMEKVRLEIEERRKSQATRTLQVIEERLAKRLRSKEEEIEKIAKLNWALEEKIKSLCVENQIWRDLAQTNEATANALRTNLEQVLANVKDDDVTGGRAGLNDSGDVNNNHHHQHPLADDAESCCDSSSAGDDRGAIPVNGTNDDRRWCRSCRSGEARVLLLPCRHLCLCTVCGSSVHTCPVCTTSKTASVHINVS